MKPVADNPHQDLLTSRARRPRFFAHGELRLVILDLLTRGSSHGYELIKAIENMTDGHYAPSPGVIYPTLDFLQQQGLINVEEGEQGRKRNAITEAGQQWLRARRTRLEEMQTRLKAKTIGHALRKNPEMKRALNNLKAVLDQKVNQTPPDQATLKKIVALLDATALAISRLK